MATKRKERRQAKKLVRQTEKKISRAEKTLEKTGEKAFDQTKLKMRIGSTPEEIEKREQLHRDISAQNTKLKEDAQNKLIEKAGKKYVRRTRAKYRAKAVGNIASGLGSVAQPFASPVAIYRQAKKAVANINKSKEEVSEIKEAYTSVGDLQNYLAQQLNALTYYRSLTEK